MEIIDRSRRIKGNNINLEECRTLQGKKLYFDSIAEMIVTRAHELGDKTFVYYYDEEVTYTQLNDRSNQVANFLKEKDVVKGDIVAVMVLNSPEFYYTTFGAQKLEAISAQINYMLMPPEIAYLLDDCKPKVVFVSSDFIATFAKGYAMAEHKPIVVEVVTDVKHDETIAKIILTEIMDSYSTDEALIPPTTETRSEPFLLLYSSGTTGKPKGVLLSNRNEYAVCKQMAAANTYLPDEIYFMAAPMFHVNQLCVYSYPLIFMGHSIVIRKMFSPNDFWPSIIKYGVTYVWGTPAMYAYVIKLADPEKIDLSKVKLRSGSMGGAPVPLELIEEFRDKFGFTFTDGYGLTESTGFCTTTVARPFKHGPIGGVIPELQLEIMDEDNNILPYGEKGEICVKGEPVMIGYFNNPEATAEVIKDDWLHTGDLGYMDEYGYVYFLGRVKEMINRGGENIYPREIEIPLEGHPKIEQVAVVGKPDPAVGERVKACIILRPDETMTEQEVKDYLKDKLAKYKIPEFVQFYDSFPLNASNKVMKSQLKD